MADPAAEAAHANGADPPYATPPIADPLQEGVPFEAVAQACAIAIADAVAHLRNTEIVANTVVGIAMERLLSEVDAGQARAAIDAATGSVKAAVEALAQVGDVTNQILRTFPKPTPP